VLSNGTVDCWGDNTDGEAGTGSTTGPESCPSGSGTFNCADVATPVAGLSGAVAVSSGDGANCALLSSGKAVCWGEGDYGTLGNNAFVAANPAPVPIVW
jgi:alpha-tubulin suppressor-like RCC1 family protein